MQKFDPYSMTDRTKKDNEEIFNYLDQEIDLFIDNTDRIFNNNNKEYIADGIRTEAGKGIIKMNKNTIIKALRNGEYEIREESECNIEWGIEECYGDYVLNPNIVSDQCWIGKVLYITDDKGEEQPIAQNIICYPMESLVNNENIDIDEIEEIFDNETNKIFSVEMGIDEECDNESHNDEMKDTLLDFINDNELICYICYPRNFSNEYTCILVDKSFNTDKLPANAEKLTHEEWVKKYLKKNDAATKYYIGFKYYC